MKLNVPETTQQRIVVVGGGFAGLALVRKLEKSPCQIVLIDRNNFHQFQPLLYQVATAALSPGDIAFPFRKITRNKSNIHFRMAEVEAIDPEGKTLKTNRGSLTYDVLVLASGSTTNFFGMTDVENSAMPMKDLSEALAIRNRVLSHLEKAVQMCDNEQKQALLNIVIVGGGPAGVELAGAFAEMKKYIIPQDYPELARGEVRVCLIEGSGKLIGAMSEKTSKGTLKELAKMGVEVKLNTVVSDYKENKVIFKNGDSMPTENLIWTSGVKVAVPEGLKAARTDRSGRIETDFYFAVKGYKDIYAVGDASLQLDESHPRGYPQLARVAMEQAKHLASNLKNATAGKPIKPYKYVDYPVMATVGRNRAFAEFGKLRMKGFLAWVAWAVVHIVTMLGVRNRISVMWGWFWNYITFDLPTRIIVFQPQKKKLDPATTQTKKQ